MNLVPYYNDSCRRPGVGTSSEGLAVLLSGERRTRLVTSKLPFLQFHSDHFNFTGYSSGLYGIEHPSDLPCRILPRRGGCGRRGAEWLSAASFLTNNFPGKALAKETVDEHFSLRGLSTSSQSDTEQPGYCGTPPRLPGCLMLGFTNNTSLDNIHSTRVDWNIPVNPTY